MDKKNTKYLQLAETLRREIAKQAPGSAFMTVRHIMEKFGMSQATTTKALEILDNEGLVERSLGSGIYVTEKAALLKSCPSTICLAMPNWPSNRFQSYELNFYELAEELGFLPEVLRFAWSDAVPAKLPPIKIDGIAIYTASQEHMLLPKLPALEAFGVPYAFINRNVEDLNISCAYCDDRDEGAIAADHLIKTGHRKIAVMLTEPHQERRRESRRLRKVRQAARSRSRRDRHRNEERRALPRGHLSNDEKAPGGRQAGVQRCVRGQQRSSGWALQGGLRSGLADSGRPLRDRRQRQRPKPLPASVLELRERKP